MLSIHLLLPKNSTRHRERRQIYACNACTRASGLATSRARASVPMTFRCRRVTSTSSPLAMCCVLSYQSRILHRALRKHAIFNIQVPARLEFANTLDERFVHLSLSSRCSLTAPGVRHTYDIHTISWTHNAAVMHLRLRARRSRLTNARRILS